MWPWLTYKGPIRLVEAPVEVVCRCVVCPQEVTAATKGWHTNPHIKVDINQVSCQVGCIGARCTCKGIFKYDLGTRSCCALCSHCQTGGNPFSWKFIHYTTNGTNGFYIPSKRKNSHILCIISQYYMYFTCIYKGKCAGNEYYPLHSGIVYGLQACDSIQGKLFSKGIDKSRRASAGHYAPLLRCTRA